MKGRRGFSKTLLKVSLAVSNSIASMRNSAFLWVFHLNIWKLNKRNGRHLHDLHFYLFGKNSKILGLGCPCKVQIVCRLLRRRNPPPPLLLFFIWNEALQPEHWKHLSVHLHLREWGHFLCKDTNFTFGTIFEKVKEATCCNVSSEWLKWTAKWVSMQLLSIYSHLYTESNYNHQLKCILKKWYLCSWIIKPLKSS